ncbi:MAG: hypothetical protein ABIN80_21210 [Dyadobacter sp.]|uniref:hypothetical protein n=1 Tax=Dyadobacter sp. TaxID=1914288 RepID=UPI003266A46E
MQNYRDYVKQIFPLGFEDLIYYYELTEYNGNYESYFQFCQENLLTQWQGLDFHPCFIYFRNDKELQALARRLSTGEGIIEINNGLFEKLNDIFYQNRKFISSLPGVSQLEDENLMDAPMYYLMFQELMLFLYYHELGHVIQFSQMNMMITERNMASKGFDNSLLLHVMEMDSDEIASNFTIHHIMATWEKAPIEHVPTNSLKL